jgi:hypothetical protein
MAHRHLLQLKVFLACVLPLTVAFIGLPPESAEEQAEVPRFSAGQEDNRIRITWTFRGRDVFECENSAYHLREVVRRHKGQVLVEALAVDADSTLVASFLRSEHLPLAFTVLNERDYRRRYGREPTPAVYVAAKGTLVEALTAGHLRVQGRRTTTALSSVVATLLAHPQSSLADH